MLDSIQTFLSGDPLAVIGRVILAMLAVTIVRFIAGAIYNKALRKEYRYDGAVEGFATVEIPTPLSRLAEGVHFAGDMLLIVLLLLGCGTLLLNISVILVTVQKLNKPDHLNDLMRNVARDLAGGLILLAVVIALLGLVRALFQALSATAQTLGKPKEPAQPPPPPQRAKRY